MDKQSESVKTLFERSKTYTPYCKVKLGGNVSIATSQTLLSPMTYGYVTNDPTMFENSGNGIKCKFKGSIKFTYNVETSGMNTSTWLYNHILVNGAEVLTPSIQGSVGRLTTEDTVEVNENDVITISVHAGVAGGLVSQGVTRLIVERLS